MAGCGSDAAGGFRRGFLRGQKQILEPDACMSHLHKLFYTVPDAEDTAPSLPAAPPVDNVVTPSRPAAPTIVTLPVVPAEEAHLTPESRIIYWTDPRNAAAERFRLLRMRLKTHWSQGKLKKLLITSSLAQDGKSTIVLNLATALAERGKRGVLVLDADLHRPAISAKLGVPRWAGLAECLADHTISPLSAIRRIEPLGWYLLPAGEPRKSPAELLQSPAFGQIMAELAGRFDWVLLDSPPVIALTDAISLQQHVDGTLLVARAEQTPREAVEQSVALLGGKNIVGVVLNGANPHDHLGYGKAYYYHSTKRGD
jgi:capsular exopolysaccharide synthesis family protein